MEGESFFCARCQRNLLPLEVQYLAAGNTTMTTCTRCGSAVVREVSRVKRPLVGELLTSMKRAFTPITLAVTVVVLLVTGVISFAGEPGAWLAFAIRTGYLFAVLRAASTDVEDVTKSEMPTFMELMMPAIRLAFVFVIAFLPAFALRWFGAPAPVVVLAILIGLLYFPAAVILAAHADAMGDAMDPIAAFRLIGRIPGPYLIAVAMLTGLVVVTSAVWFVVGLVLNGSVIGFVIAPILSFQPLVCAMRLLGTLAWEQREDI